MQLPDVETLLSETRRDWVVLQDGRVLVVEPVFPRPNTLAKIDAERDAILTDPKRRFSPEGRERLNALTKLSIFLPGKDASTEYQLSVTDVKEIIHHEDLMLQRADQLIDAGETRKAFELLFVVARRDPQWPGLEPRQIKLVAADASHQLDDGNGERALTFIESLYERKPVPDAADDLLDHAADLLIGSAVKAGDFRRARFELQRIRGIDPRHPAPDRWAGQLASLAGTLQAEAERAAANGNAALAAETIDRAARVWPSLNGLRPAHARLTSRYQRLLVGVPAVAPQESLLIPSDADDRIGRLTEGALFELDGFEGTPLYRSIYFERWEPTDLGRRARFELRPGLPTWSARPPLTSSEIVSLLSQRMSPGSPSFDYRFADLAEELRVLGPYEFEIVFRRAPLRVESCVCRTPPPMPPPRPPAPDTIRPLAGNTPKESIVT
jgi:tetratricopeptide (TPR) repeat protein